MTDLDRFRPVRAGIVNLYEYGEQVFEFAGGRLLLRGHNTSGKTKALELLLPFVLDGDISPRKLDPFASGEKEMKWNLVGCIEREQRRGYVWLELERLRADQTERVTVGIGLAAHRERPGVRRWYWIARGRRVGDDLALLGPGREPIAKAELVARLGDDGEVLDSQQEYRDRLARDVFGFTDPERYRTMLGLMLELRRPHLSKRLDPDSVSGLLAAGLPPVDERLMRRLAGALEQLETLEAQLRRLRGVRERVRRFNDRTYRAYARAIVRDRASALREAETRFAKAREQERSTRHEIEAHVAAREDARGRIARCAAQHDTLTGEERAILGSAAWASVAEVDRLRQQTATQRRSAQRALEAADAAEARLIGLEADAITASAAADAAREDALAVLVSGTERAADGGFGERFGALAGELSSGRLTPSAWAGIARDLTRGRKAILERHAGLRRTLGAALDKRDVARDAEADASQQLASAADKLALSDDGLSAARSDAGTRLATWATGLRELAPGEPELDDALGLLREGDAAARAFAAAATAASEKLLAARAKSEARRERSRTRRAEIDAAVARLRDERDDEPGGPPWPRGDRCGRDGAPLWRLVDFRASLPGADRARLEAALHAMGVLDAWIDPDGAARSDEHDLDVLLTDGLPAGEPAETLLAVLEPLEQGSVPVALVERLLARVAFADCANAGVQAAVGRDGSFAIGPLRGAASKAEPEFVGATARARRRERRIHELIGQRDDVDLEIAECAGDIEKLDERLERLRMELAALPDPSAIASALRARSVAAELEQQERRRHDAAAGHARRCAEAAEQARDRVRDHAATHGLPARLDFDGLDAQSEACSELIGLAPGIARAWTLAQERTGDLKAREEAIEPARRAVAGARQLEQAEGADAARLGAELDAREQALGDEGARLRARRVDVERELRAVAEDRDHLAAAERTADLAVGRLDGDLQRVAADAERFQHKRGDSQAAFAALGRPGLLRLAVGEQASPVDDATAASWTLTRALEVARTVPPDVRDLRSSAGELGQAVIDRVTALDRELTALDRGAHLVQSDDLWLVQITEGPTDRPLAEVVEALDAEVIERERLLNEEERRVFGDALVEELADHLRARLFDVQQLVAQMNAVLERCPTSAGKTVALEWRAREHDEELREAVRLLPRDIGYHDGSARERIVAFFRRRIQTARDATDADQPMATTLTTAFDYRTWFSFGLLERQDGRSVRLTRRRHATGSGGEQSVLVHLPLLAAAAALYADSRGPRLVMLDEALSGIDDDTRERVLAATVNFDLDLVMTSHELWGTHRSVPQLAIYQLHRENGAFGVHAVPFVWDGHVLHELEQDELVL